MINIEIREHENIFVLAPDGEISADDFKAAAQTLNDYINTHDRVPNLVFQTESLPHWKNFEALREHFKIVRDHHKLIRKVAIVSDSTVISLLHPFVDLFTGAKIRRFPERALDDAINWAQMEEDQPGEFIEMEGLPHDVIGLDARGLITSANYRDQFAPLVEARLREHDKLKLLMVFGPYFDSYSAGAVWDDARFGLSHFTTFSRIALVTDIEWLRHSAKAFGMLMPSEVMVFDFDELDDAKAWIVS